MDNCWAAALAHEADGVTNPDAEATNAMTRANETFMLQNGQP